MPFIVLKIFLKHLNSLNIYNFIFIFLTPNLIWAITKIYLEDTNQFGFITTYMFEYTSSQPKGH
jgi:hypothetical protein